MQFLWNACSQSSDQPRRSIPGRLNKVELAISPLAKITGAAGYHTSVVVSESNGGHFAEFSFGPWGILGCAVDILSPNTGHSENPTVLYIGCTQLTGAQMVKFLQPYFKSDSYDILKKNCNHFSDCCLSLLCGTRLALCYRAAEEFGELSGWLPTLSLGHYEPNPNAVGFDVHSVLAEIDDERSRRAANAPHIAKCSPRPGETAVLPSSGVPTALTALTEIAVALAASAAVLHVRGR